MGRGGILMQDGEWVVVVAIQGGVGRRFVTFHL